MDNFNLDELMDLAEAYVGPMVDAIYRRLMDRDFALEDPEGVMLLTALINILGHDNSGDHPTEVLLLAAYGDRGVLERPNMRVMRSKWDKRRTGKTRRELDEMTKTMLSIEEEWEVHHRDHEKRTGCRMDRVAFMEEVWTVVQSYGTQSILKLGLNRPLMREVLDKLDECEGRLSDLLLDSAADESEANSPIKMTPQEDKGEVVYLSRTRKRTMQSKLVSDNINEMKMKLGSEVTLRKAGKTKVDVEISIKAVKSAKRKRIEAATDLGQGDDRLPGTDRMLTDVVMVPPILMTGTKSTGYKTKKIDRTLTGATLEMEKLSQCGESTMKDFKPSPMNHGKGSVVGQLVPVEYNRLTV